MHSNLRQIVATSLLVASAITTTALAAPTSSSADSRPSLAFSPGLVSHLSSPDDMLNPLNSGAAPSAMPEDSRIVVFSYNENQVYKILTAPAKTTTIELGPDEKLTSEPAMGDSIRWEIDSDGKNHLYLKPHQANTVNTVSFSTNKHDYDFTAVSSPPGGMFYQRVRFQYHGSLLAKTESVQAQINSGPHAADVGPIGTSPDKLNWNYEPKGSASFKPTAIFDDGKFLWMRLPENAPWPVAFSKEGGKEVVVNTIRRGDFLVVQQLSDDIILRRDKVEVEVKPTSRGLFGSW